MYQMETTFLFLLLFPASIKEKFMGSQNDCDAEETDDLVIVTDFGWDVACFHRVGTMSVGLYDVYYLQTDLYITTCKRVSCEENRTTGQQITKSYLVPPTSDRRYSRPVPPTDDLFPCRAASQSTQDDV